MTAQDQMAKDQADRIRAGEEMQLVVDTLFAEARISGRSADLLLELKNRLLPSERYPEQVIEMLLNDAVLVPFAMSHGETLRSSFRIAKYNGRQQVEYEITFTPIHK